MPEAGIASPDARRRWRAFAALIAGQVGLHAAMAGTRMAAPLQALQEGRGPWTVGVLMALFAAAPVLLAMPAGRLADRYGYHRPLRIAVALEVAGMLLALLSTRFEGLAHLGLLFVAASLAGGGANVGLITIQRTAGRSARDSVERVRVFSWLGLAPALANVVGPVTCGLLIDHAGFWAAYAAMLLLPLATLGLSRLVPHEAPPRVERPGGRTAWELWRMPGLARLMTINWMLSTCWDVHGFAVPILGHERGFSASTIGLVLGVFPASVTAVRLLIPLIAHRADESAVLRGAMLGTGVVFAIYPLMPAPWMMGLCAIVLGLTLGSVQPMILSTLHHLTPHDRHGEAIALRSMTINTSSTVMPLLFGMLGTALGVAPLFWIVGGVTAAGSSLARRFQASGRSEAEAA